MCRCGKLGVQATSNGAPSAHEAQASGDTWYRCVNSSTMLLSSSTFLLRSSAVPLWSSTWTNDHTLSQLEVNALIRGRAMWADLAGNIAANPKSERYPQPRLDPNPNPDP